MFLRFKHCCFIFLLIMIMVSAIACVQSDLSTDKQTEKGSELLSEITVNDGFQYKNFPWFISKSDFFTLSKMDEKHPSFLNKEHSRSFQIKRHRPMFCQGYPFFRFTISAKAN